MYINSQPIDPRQVHRHHPSSWIVPATERGPSNNYPRTVGMRTRRMTVSKTLPNHLHDPVASGPASFWTKKTHSSSVLRRPSAPTFCRPSRLILCCRCCQRTRRPNYNRSTPRRDPTPPRYYGLNFYSLSRVRHGPRIFYQVVKYRMLEIRCYLSIWQHEHHDIAYKMLKVVYACLFGRTNPNKGIFGRWTPLMRFECGIIIVERKGTKASQERR